SSKFREAVDAKPKQCYYNAYKCILKIIEDDELGKYGIREEHWEHFPLYVEGIACIRSLGIPLEHGWIEWDKGQVIIDPTWCDAEGEIAYFAMKKFTLPELLAALSAAEGEDEETYLPILWNHIR